MPSTALDEDMDHAHTWHSLAPIAMPRHNEAMMSGFEITSMILAWHL